MPDNKLLTTIQNAKPGSMIDIRLDRDGVGCVDSFAVEDLWALLTAPFTVEGLPTRENLEKPFTPYTIVLSPNDPRRQVLKDMGYTLDDYGDSVAVGE